MKKLTSLFLILFIIPFMAFAAVETHQMIIKTSVSEVLPSFHLVYGGTDGTLAADYTNKGNVVFKTETYSSEYDKSHAMEVVDISEDDIDAVFYCKVTPEGVNNYIKTTNKFNVGFTAGDFSVVRDGTAGTLSATTKTLEAVTGEISTTSSNSSKVGSELKNGVVEVKFDGSRTTSSGNVAKFTVKYPQDTAVNPGSYYATITMTITLE